MDMGDGAAYVHRDSPDASFLLGAPACRLAAGEAHLTIPLTAGPACSITPIRIVILSEEARKEMTRIAPSMLLLLSFVAVTLAACSDDLGTAHVMIKNDFDNPEMTYQPPWTICESSYLGVEFGKLGTGETSALQTVTPGLDYVLMVAAWDDPTCAPENCLPIASKNEEEVVDGQSRTIAINLSNHQGACPPEGVAPIPEEQYDRILALWPEYGFQPYASRTQNTQCLP